MNDEVAVVMSSSLVAWSEMKMMVPGDDRIISGEGVREVIRGGTTRPRQHCGTMRNSV